MTRSAASELPATTLEYFAVIADTFFEVPHLTVCNIGREQYPPNLNVPGYEGIA